MAMDDQPLGSRSGAASSLGPHADMRPSTRDETPATTTQTAKLTELQHANRLATVGRLAAGLAHEFGTPLGVVLARAQMIISDDAGPEEMRADAEAIIQQVKRMTQMCRE